jgi:hypothetical protein
VWSLCHRDERNVHQWIGCEGDLITAPIVFVVVVHGMPTAYADYTEKLHQQHQKSSIIQQQRYKNNDEERDTTRTLVIHMNTNSPNESDDDVVSYTGFNPEEPTPEPVEWTANRDKIERSDGFNDSPTQTDRKKEWSPSQTALAAWLLQREPWQLRIGISILAGDQNGRDVVMRWKTEDDDDDPINGLGFWTRHRIWILSAYLPAADPDRPSRLGVVETGGTSRLETTHVLCRFNAASGSQSHFSFARLVPGCGEPGGTCGKQSD